MGTRMKCCLSVSTVSTLYGVMSTFYIGELTQDVPCRHSVDEWLLLAWPRRRIRNALYCWRQRCSEQTRLSLFRQHFEQVRQLGCEGRCEQTIRLIEDLSFG